MIAPAKHPAETSDLHALLNEALALAALMRLCSRRLTRAVARARMAHGAEAPDLPPGLTDADTVAELCRRLGADPEVMRGRSRHGKIVLQRTALIHELRKCGWSTPRIGAQLRRTHGTILHALARS